MRSKAACVSVLVRFVTFSMMVSGCGQTGTANRPGDGVVVRDVAAANVHVIDVQSHQEGGELVISGRVKRSYNFCCDDAKGHVDIVVVDSDGFVVANGSTYYSPRNIPKTRTRSSRFEARLPIILPQGTVIRTAYHKDSKFAEYAPGTRTLQCRLNMATPGLDAL